MPRTRRFATRKASPSSTTPTLQTQDVQPNENLQNGIQRVEPQPRELESQQNQVSNQSQQQNEGQPPYKPKRVCNNYWVVDVTDDYGKITQERLRIRDVLVLPEVKRVRVPWNEENQPVSDAAALLNGFLGHLACNTNIFPICYDRWPNVPSSYKANAWEKTIMKKFNIFHHDHYEYCMGSMGKKWKNNRWRLCNYYYKKDLSYEQNLENFPDGLTREQWAGFLQYKLSDKAKKYSEINTRNRAKQTIMHTLGSKSIARTKYDLEEKHGRKFSRGEMWAIGHTKKDGSFVSDEAREKNDQLQAEIEETTSEDEAFETVFGKEHPGRVRGIGYGVVISQMRKRRGSSASSSSAGPSQAEHDAIKEELNDLKRKMGELESLKAQMASIMQHLNAQQPSHMSLNEVADLGSQC